MLIPIANYTLNTHLKNAQEEQRFLTKIKGKPDSKVLAQAQYLSVSYTQKSYSGIEPVHRLYYPGFL